MRKWLIIGVVVLAAVAGASFYGIEIFPTQRFRSALDAELAALPPGVTASYADAHYSVFPGRATITGVKIHHADPTPYDVSIGEIDAVHPAFDIAASWAHAAAAPDSVAPDAALVLADDIAAANIAYHDPMTDATIRSLHAVRPRVYPWALLRPGVPSMAEARAALTATAGHTPTLADVMPLLRLEASLMLGMGFDHYGGEGVAVTGKAPASATTPATTVTYAIDKYDSAAYDRGVGGLATIDGLTAHNDLFAMTVAHTEVDGIAVRDPLTKLLADGAPDPAMLDGLAVKRIVYGPMTFQAGKQKPAAIGTLSLAGLTFSHGLLASAVLVLDGFRVGRGQAPNSPVDGLLDELGLDTLTLSFKLGYRWDPEQRKLSISDTVIDVRELGTLRFALDLDGIGSPQDALTRGRLVHALLRYEDASLAYRGMTLLALQKHVPEVTMRQQIIAMVEQTAGSPSANPGMRAVAEFLADPHSLQIEIAPPAPIPLLELLTLWMGGIGRALPQLGATIAANQ
jgi:hypothetical protein